MAGPEPDDVVAAEVLAHLVADTWWGPGPPPDDYVAALAGTYLYHLHLLAARMRALAGAVREAARWN